MPHHTTRLLHIRARHPPLFPALQRYIHFTLYRRHIIIIRRAFQNEYLRGCYGERVRQRGSIVASLNYSISQGQKRLYHPHSLQMIICRLVVFPDMMVSFLASSSTIHTTRQHVPGVYNYLMTSFYSYYALDIICVRVLERKVLIMLLIGKQLGKYAYPEVDRKSPPSFRRGRSYFSVEKSTSTGSNDYAAQPSTERMFVAASSNCFA